MIDILAPADRSERMRRIKSKNTKPELALRKVLHGRGLRYRLHGAELPGKPDIIFKKNRLAVFVHGCFWHQHTGCKTAHLPKSNTEFWNNKLEKNKNRDQSNIDKIKNLGWDVIIVWECEIKNDISIQNMASLIENTIRIKTSPCE